MRASRYSGPPRVCGQRVCRPMRMRAGAYSQRVCRPMRMRASAYSQRVCGRPVCGPVRIASRYAGGHAYAGQWDAGKRICGHTAHGYVGNRYAGKRTCRQDIMPSSASNEAKHLGRATERKGATRTARQTHGWTKNGTPGRRWTSRRPPKRPDGQTDSAPKRTDGGPGQIGRKVKPIPGVNSVWR